MYWEKSGRYGLNIRRDGLANSPSVKAMPRLPGGLIRKSGKSGCMGDIGTHAAHLAEYITGLNITNLCAASEYCGGRQYA